MTTKPRGFTLIELLITVAIIGIIASVAYPSYVENIRQSKRKEAEAALVSFANAMEMWKMQNNNSYLGTTAAAVFGTTVPISGGTTTYTLGFSTTTPPTATTYTLEATPAGSDPTCGVLALTNTGLKTPTTAGCW